MHPWHILAWWTPRVNILTVVNLKWFIQEVWKRDQLPTQGNSIEVKLDHMLIMKIARVKWVRLMLQDSMNNLIPEIKCLDSVALLKSQFSLKNLWPEVEFSVNQDLKLDQRDQVYFQKLALEFKEKQLLLPLLRNLKLSKILIKWILKLKTLNWQPKN